MLVVGRLKSVEKKLLRCKQKRRPGSCWSPDFLVSDLAVQVLTEGCRFGCICPLWRDVVGVVAGLLLLVVDVGCLRLMMLVDCC
jgi:hypothetical protein